MRPSGSVYVPVRVGPTVVVGRVSDRDGCSGCFGCGGCLGLLAVLLFVVGLIGAATR